MTEPAAPTRAPLAPLLAAGVAPRRAVRVGVVGAGKMGVAHAAVLSMIPNVTLAGFADRERAAGRRMRGLGFRAPVHATVDALLRDARPDAVWICTPPDSHWPLARVCVEAGAAVFVEKPLAHTVADAERLAALAARAAVPMACGYTLAFWPSFCTAQHLLELGALGALRAARSTMYLSGVSGRGLGWMHDPARSGGGVVANLASHALFLLRWYVGLPTRARATWRHLHGGAVEDELEGTFVMDDGREIGLETSWSVPGYPISVTTVELTGENGRLQVANDRLTVELDAARAGLAAGTTVLREAELPHPAEFDLNGEAYYLEDAHVLAWVTGGPPPPITLAAALDVQRMIAALYHSAGRGGESVAVGEAG